MEVDLKPAWLVQFKIEDSVWASVCADANSRGYSPLSVALEMGLLNENILMTWDRERSGLASLKGIFFNGEPPLELWTQYDLRRCLASGCMPVGSWEQIVYFAKLSSEPTSFDRELKNVTWVLAPWTGMKKWFRRWEKLEVSQASFVGRKSELIELKELKETNPTGAFINSGVKVETSEFSLSDIKTGGRGFTSPTNPITSTGSSSSATESIAESQAGADESNTDESNTDESDTNGSDTDESDGDKPDTGETEASSSGGPIGVNTNSSNTLGSIDFSSLLPVKEEKKSEPQKPPPLSNIETTSISVIVPKQAAATPITPITPLQSAPKNSIAAPIPKEDVDSIDDIPVLKPRSTTLSPTKDQSPVQPPIIKKESLAEIKSPIPVETIIERLNSAKSQDELAQVCMGGFHNYFDKVMIFLMQNPRLMIWKWSGNWTGNIQRGDVVSLDLPSIFKIVADTSHPYHGYICRCATNDSFFARTDRDEYPDHVTILPILADETVVAMVFGSCSKEAAKTLSLSRLEEHAHYFSDALTRFVPPVRRTG